MTDNTPCPCGRAAAYADCCGRYHAGAMRPLMAEQLMRSRYAAFVCHRIDYLRETLLPTRRRDFDVDATAAWNETVHWLGLSVLECTQGGPRDTAGTVRFVAKLEVAGEAQEICENSQFAKRGGVWFYVREVR